MQQKAAQDIKDLEQKLSDMQQEENQESQSEDINSLRQILENLIKASFDQENLMDELADTKTTDPKYISVMQDQKNLQSDLQMIEDSLFALSKRQMQIESFVNKEISEINDDVE